MAKVQVTEHKNPVEIEDRFIPAERTVNITLNEQNINEAIFMWLRLQDIELPSQRVDDYKIYHKGNAYDSHHGGKAPIKIELTFKENP